MRWAFPQTSGLLDICLISKALLKLLKGYEHLFKLPKYVKHLLKIGYYH